jgi:peptidoglycan/xylan/chitin deacetylase (PgdA/CDA1 family)
VSLLFHDVYRGEPRESGFDSEAADRYKLSIQEFETQLSGVARVRSEPPILASDLIAGEAQEVAQPFRAASAGLKPCATSEAAVAFPYLITVDDGGLSYYTVVADRLERIGWRGHCFVTTNCIGQRGFLTVRQIRELDARGHIIGSHSASHPMRFSACSIPQMRREWTRSREALQDLLGHPVNVASVPGGYFSAVVARTAGDAGLRVLFTSEPTTRTRTHHGCFVIGRYTVRARCRDDFASRIVLPPPHTRAAAWAGWNAKKVVKPLLGSTYARVADWLLATRSGTLKSEV